MVYKKSLNLRSSILENLNQTKKTILDWESAKKCKNFMKFLNSGKLDSG